MNDCGTGTLVICVDGLFSAYTTSVSEDVSEVSVEISESMSEVTVSVW